MLPRKSNLESGYKESWFKHENFHYGLDLPFVDSRKALEMAKVVLKGEAPISKITVVHRTAL